MEPTGRETPPSGGNRAADRLAEDHPIRTGHNSHSRADPTRDTNHGSSHGNPERVRSRAGGETTAPALA